MRALALISFIALVALAAPALSRVMIPHALRGPTQYMEIVREQKNCTKDCFVEYFLLSNGKIIRTHIDRTDYDNAVPSIDTRDIGEETATSVFDNVKNFLKTPRPESGRMIDPDNLYYYDGEAYHSWSAAEPAIPEFLDLLAAVDKAYSAAQPEKSFYLHEYYQPVSGATRSLHVFDGGTFVESLFDKLSYRMKSTSISQLTDAEASQTRALAAKAAVAKPIPFVQCPAATGIEYGVVEFVTDGQVQKSYTCSTENNDIAALFNFVKKLSSGD